MKKVVFLVLVVLNSCLSIEIKSSLREFANYTASQNKIKILLSDEVMNNDFFLFSYDDKEKISIEMFKDIVSSKGYILVNRGDFYYVDLIKTDDENSSNNQDEAMRYINFDNNIYEDVKNLLEIKQISSTYFMTDNSVAFYSDKETYKDVLIAVKNIDKTPKQVTFKLTITETNLNDVKTIGTNLNSLLKGIERVDFKYYINLITMPFMSETNIITSKQNDFYGVLSLLQNNGITKIKSSPFLTAKNKTSVNFYSVENIPYMVSDSKFENSGTSTQVRYDYKDVGLKINITPTILKNGVDFDLELTIEDILNQNNNTPTTSKKYIKSSYHLKYGELLVLGGINKETTFKASSGIPILKDIWLLKYIFSTTYDKSVNSVLTLTIEVL